ncbi:MAG: ACP S-malonyltransferase [Halobacteriovoraceae bacterium]|jgi:[acyl-carrier-protein] S-malonyltransferase|nr:ACP S-malonyltransferase [Halobacteriovoraceae bacterium]MBT5094173.1 ACP S-malonyltransferase [Halobacteriovoraceae bacterium]
MTKSVTLIFPGQGSQYVGMGSQLKDHPSFEWLAKADKSLEYSLSKMMLDGPDEELKLTANTQPAILAHSVALFDKVWALLIKKEIKIDRVLGHSVGEYAALVAAKVLNFEDAVKAVHLRGKYMQEAVPAGAGKMVAIMKVPGEKIIEGCQASSTATEQVMPANFNEPNQTVVSGHTAACDRFVKWLEENHSDPYRAIELNVSAPFHSSLMEPAADKLKAHFDNIEFRPNELPYIANVDAKELPVGTSPEIIKENLYQQVAGSVLWSQSIEQLPDDTLCIEVGPGRVLMGLLRKINRNIKVISLDKDGAFEELEELL